MKILFVCTGNTCRSCMAEVVAKKLASDELESFEFSSAGIYAVMGESATNNAVSVMEELGIDLSCHIATPINLEMIKEADIILTMTLTHKQLVLNHFSEAKDKTHTLLEYIGQAGDIEDPFGGDLSIYRNCAQIIRASIEKLLLILKES